MNSISVWRSVAFLKSQKGAPHCQRLSSFSLGPMPQTEKGEVRLAMPTAESGLTNSIVTVSTTREAMPLSNTRLHRAALNDAFVCSSSLARAPRDIVFVGIQLRSGGLPRLKLLTIDFIAICRLVGPFPWHAPMAL